MAAATVATQKICVGFVGNSLATLAAVGVAVIVYCVMLFVTKSITRDEIATLPKGKTILRIVDKIKR